ncbi:MAG: cystathionine beta-lyase [Micrococcales bacterium]|nr:MAG: cystathionine beta-lyase [Micrococcales bacterium]PIE27470.1 MAG: cystathionine beta-lyase [Micrococcales bacterium]
MARRRTRHRSRATWVVILVGLFTVGGLYAVAAPAAQHRPVASATGDTDAGNELFLTNCATCHGNNAGGTENGPSLIGVGAAAVDFQVATGRMPMQATAPQAPKKRNDFSEQEIADMATYIASLGAGPDIPQQKYLDPKLDDDEVLAEGYELFRVNCAMCHNVVGAGGALTRGKYAPGLQDVEPIHIYEAMQTGPQSMPVFSDANLNPDEKQAIISYLRYASEEPSPGGFPLGSLGPVSEGLFVWTGILALIVAAAVWLGAKSS